MSTAGFIAGAVLLLAVYCATDPFKISPIADFPEFESIRVDMPKWSMVPKDRDKENLLQRSEIRFLNQVQGPESLAFDSRGRGPYTGVADGRILFWDGESWTHFAHTSSNRSELCNTKSSPLSYLKHEHICGRPLGLRFDKSNGDLYIADAYLGLMKVGPQGGLATSLATEAEGEPLRFCNDLDIDEHGNVYFTDSSITYQRRHFMQMVFSGDNTGRLLKYDPKTKQTKVLLRNLQFPNGLSLSNDRSFFLFCEAAVGRYAPQHQCWLTKYYLKGERAGTTQVFAYLPGYPDNVRANQKGEFWVAIHCRRNSYTYMCALYPRLRRLLLKLPISARVHFLFQVGGWPHVLAVKYSENGELLRVLEDSEGKVISAISEVEERDGKLWLGSVLLPFIAVYHLGSN